MYEVYKNLNGNSGVNSYEIMNTSISVCFTTRTYEYTYDSAGSIHIETMKDLAKEGKGLNSYINSYVKTLYARRI